MIAFAKYHGLGNDYLVVDSAEVAPLLSPSWVRRVCNRHFGLGADGILVSFAAAVPSPIRVRIFNPDGSEAEKSGNGLRIFARHLWDGGLVGSAPFEVLTAGGAVSCRVHPEGQAVTVDMGRVFFESTQIPVAGPPREVLREPITVGGTHLEFSAATIGNPHCVVVREQVSESEAKKLGPLLETEPRFPNRTNGQFLQVLDRNSIRIEIWERGAGYTLASGSSSCAAAAVARRLDLCDDSITVHMPGGLLSVKIGHDFPVTMTGPVTKVATGHLVDECWKANEEEN